MANTNSEYEDALLRFTKAVLERRPGNKFLPDFTQFQQRVARVGIFNSLSQCLLKLASPGVPDLYQGSELWQLTLVDPDNRRPVDYDLRRRMIEKLPLEGPPSPEFRETLLAKMNDGLIKLYVTQATLRIRKKLAPLFQDGRYLPLKVTGPSSQHVCAFAREYEGRSVIVAAPRLVATLLGDAFDSPCHESLWKNTEIEIPFDEKTCYHHAFTGNCIPVQQGSQGRILSAANLFSDFPVALLR